MRLGEKYIEIDRRSFECSETWLNGVKYVMLCLRRNLEVLLLSIQVSAAGANALNMNRRISVLWDWGEKDFSHG